VATRIVALFNLKAGVTREAYEAWARLVDLPTVNALRSIQSFEVFRMTGVLGSDAKPPYDYVEIIDVADMALFGDDVATETMQRVAGEFQAVADNPVFVLTEKLS
jgi:REDY-like protein HapK